MYSDQSKNYLQEIIILLRKGLGGKSQLLKKAITTTSTPYTAGDCIGGVQTLTTVIDAANLTSILTDVQIKDNSNQSSDLVLLFFDRHPVDVGGATCTDNAAFVYGSSFPYQIGKVEVASADYSTIDSKASILISGVNEVFKSLADGTVFMVIVAVGTPTYGANSTSLEIDLGFLKD